MTQWNTGAGRLGAIAAALMIASGCVVDVRFNPVGTDVAIEGSWTVAGLTPDATTCGEIDQVQLFVYDAFDDSFVPSIRADCETGSFDTGFVYNAGTYRVQWVAYDAAGFELQRSLFFDVNANVGDTIVSMVDFDFSEAFNPAGTEVAIEGTWTVNSLAASPASCDGIGDVELFIYHATDNAFVSAFRGACSLGGFNTGFEFAAGSYRVQWASYDLGGAQVQRSEFFSVTAAPTDTITSMVDFDPVTTSTNTTLSGAWLINGATPSVTACEAAGIDTVRLEVANDMAGSDIEIQFDFDCERGGFDARTDAPEVVLPMGFMFYSHYVALDAGGANVGETPYLELDTGVVTHAITATPDFVIVVENTLRVNFEWETGLGTGEFTNCADAIGAGTMGFTLRDGNGAGAVIAEEFGVLCEDALDFGPPLDAGIYALDVTADAADRTKYGVVCDNLDVASGLEEYDCFVVVVP